MNVPEPNLPRSVKRSWIPPALADSQKPEPALDIRAFWAVIRRRFAIIIATVLCVGVLAFLVTTQLQNRFKATAMVVVDSRDAQLIGFEPGFAAGLEDGAIDTQVEIARSNGVLSRAAETLNLANNPEFAEKPSTISRLLGLIGFGTTEAVGVDEPKTFRDLTEAQRALLVERLGQHLQIGRKGATSIITITATTLSPDGAARLANGVAESFLNEQIEAKLGSTQRAATFLQERVNSLAAEIARIEEEIDTFVTETLSELGSNEARQILLQLQEATRSKDRNLGDLIRIQSALKANDFTSLLQLVDTREDGFARRREALQQQIAGLSSEANEQLIRAQLSALESEVRKTAEERAEGIRTDLASDEQRAAQIRKQLESVLSTQDLPKDVSVELFRLQREAASSRSLYENYFSKWKQVEQQTDFNLPDSHIAAAATPPSRPSFPPIQLIMGSALIISLGAGVGLAFLREFLIGGFTNVEQFESLTKTRVVASVPRHRPDDKNQPPDWAMIAQPLSAFAEEIRRLRLAVEPFASKDRLCIVVTSAVAGEGKTTIAVALARAFSVTGRSTLLIDADLRRPSAQTYPRTLGTHGLFGYLVEKAKLEVIQELDSKLTFLLGSDASPVATDALLMSERFESLMAYARENFEIVVIDTSPVGLVVDAQIVARYADVGVFVVQFASTNQGHVVAALRELNAGGMFPVVGVLNMVDRSSRYGAGEKYYGS